MKDILNDLAQQCCAENLTLQRCCGMQEKTLADLIKEQKEKVLHNRSIAPLCDPEDLYGLVQNRVRNLLGEEEADGVVRTLRGGAVCTADHHGGLYFAQSFQGDLLFSMLLETLGIQEKAVPIFCAGQVELENASYARGICASMSEAGKQYFPIFPARESVRLASYTAPISEEMLRRFRHRFVETGGAGANHGESGLNYGGAGTKQGESGPNPEEAGLRQEASGSLEHILDRILANVYERKAVLDAACFSDQVTRIGAALSGHLFAGEGKNFVYLEMESLLLPLLDRELEDPCSLLYGVLSDAAIRQILAEEKLPDGSCMADILFWGADEKGRKLHLTLTQEGTLIGKDWRGQSVRYPADLDSIRMLLAQKRIFPGVFTMVLITFFERGLTWLGGMFQCVYLPQYQEALVRILRKCNFAREADVIDSYVCDGYISGPVFGLYRGQGFAVPFGPVEAFGNRLSLARARETALRTPLWDAHLMGLSDIYFDLVPRSRRAENWYQDIARQLYVRYPDHAFLM